MSDKNRARKLEMLSKVDVTYYSAMMALCGDKGDNVQGLSGIGEVKAVEAFQDTNLVKILLGEFNDLVERIVNGGNYINNSNDCINISSPIWKKAIANNEVVTRSFKLISFEVLTKTLEKRSNLYEIKNLKYIDSILNKEEFTKISSGNVLLNAMKNLPDFSLNEEIIYTLF